MPKYLFIINEKAGRTKVAGKRIKKIIEILKDRFQDYEVVSTCYKGHATQLAKGAVGSGCDMVVAVGGDGTVNEVAKGLAGSNIPLGIIPMGSGNGFAKHLKIPENPRKAVDLLLRKEYRSTDFWHLNDHHFLCLAGFGFDAMIAKEMASSTRRGLWEYVRLVLVKSFQYKAVELDFSCDGKRMQKKLLMLILANAGQFGNNVYIAPGAKSDDGYLELIMVNPVYKLLYPLLGLSILLKIPQWFPFYQRYKTKSVEIHHSSSALFHVDGEPAEGQLPYKIELHTSSLKVCAPSYG